MKRLGAQLRAHKVVILSLVAMLLFATNLYRVEVCTNTDGSVFSKCESHGAAVWVILVTARFVDSHNGAVAAIATLVIAWFTIRLTAATKGTLKQLEAEFLATHRPRLIVRTVMFRDDPDPFKPVVVSTEFANAGETVGTITHFRILFRAFWTGQPIPFFIRAELDKQNAESGRSAPVENGDSVVILQQMTEEVVKQFFSDDCMGDDPPRSIYCVGDIEYSDATGTISRRTGFIRRLNANQRLFERVNDSDFEYAD